jgi:hypothetical protein
LEQEVDALLDRLLCSPVISGNLLKGHIAGVLH